MTTSVMLLLVEDEDMVRDVLVHALTDSGYEVITADDGAQAVAELEADAARFRALITDIRLGEGPDGWQVAQRAREIDPAMPVVYMSGDSTQDWASKGVPGSLALAKPFAPAQLITAVSGLITHADMHPASPPEAPPAPG